jgi:probable blue pigment (indigoidine) exporter
MNEGATRPAHAEPLRRSDLLLLVLLGVIWGAAFPVIRLGLLAGASPLAFGFARFTGAAVVMALLALGSREKWPARRTLLASALFGGVLLIGGYAALLYLGEAVISAGLSSVLIATLPLWGALLGYGLIPGDRLAARGTLGLAVGFGGVVVLFLPDLAGGGASALHGALLVIGAAVAAAAGSVLLRRWVTAPPSSWGLTTEFAAASILLGLLAFSIPGQAHIPWNTTVLLALLYLIALPSIVGYSLYFRLLHRVGPHRANLVTYVNPVAGIVVGVALLGESVSASELFGFLLIVAGLVLVRSDSG